MRFRIEISAEKYLLYYNGSARNVITRSFDGRRVQFPASSLRPFVTHKGISGTFELRFDQNNKLIELVRIGD
ncbi:DUF2835 domain-containing protein [Candidatus Reidiella endopervernicosa]|nr:DUF2835 domain-containing protein [Candidatus Reidiella endopervernicosa]